MIENFSTVGKRIEKSLEVLGIKAVDVCRSSGISKNAMSNYINGNRVPNAEILVKLSDVLKVSIDWLLTGKGKGPEKAANFIFQEPVIEQDLVAESEASYFHQVEDIVRYNIEIGKNITHVREDAKMDVEQLAAAINIKPQALKDYESGKKVIPSYVIHRICKELSVLPLFLLDPEEVIDKEYKSENADFGHSLTQFEQDTLHFFRELSRSDQEEIAHMITFKHEKGNKKGRSSRSTNGDNRNDEQAAASEKKMA
ncbi:plasmid maintenance system antidote protein, XRE family [Alkaliphilus metalliredigens QYMF]|uniref:Plasmid maintenance system antidote protein, XRE family n=1 Tax=Alkaliphilus metalliredigens (strain QYMF) TaxID=293826 RepID=A6TK93_ALKMQ|nr:helix-turn-helix transcriptional regulator [Alkaliphilus metalliredigens]ABR46611.1 plasmid maintenance system antidote protein, XRE family [Alkaliphilus metalliredigens QYMF]ABR48085.1 plasmid maintenance system antidote protein, XRE family [Alkaliphilus metalliredigens QYMF]ABR50473.1 plasmid maintenance system antidote protein, XRE family [Alkaliphilus metalliredigens QYMF]